MQCPAPPAAVSAFPRPLALLLVDDQAVVRHGLSGLLAQAPLVWRALATARNSAQALCVAASLRPDVVLLDADLGGEDGLVLIPLLAPAAVLVLSSQGRASTRARALALGAVGYLEKHQPAADLLRALQALARTLPPQLRGEQAPTQARSSSRDVPVGSSDAGNPQAT